MRITDERLEAFKKLYCDRFKIQLTDEEALAKGLRTLRLMELVYKPLPSSIRLKKRRIRS